MVDLKYAQKVEQLGADAIIAVNNRAGGHAGNLSPEELIPLLNENCNIPVISAGGVGNHKDLEYIMGLGGKHLKYLFPLLGPCWVYKIL